MTTVRQESWRTSVDNTNILEVEEVGPCLTLSASDHELRCNWEKKDLPAYKYWDPGNWHVSFRLGREPLNPCQTAVQTLGPFPRAELLTIKDLAHVYYY